MSVAAGLLAAACVLFAPGVSVKKTVLPSGVAVHEWESISWTQASGGLAVGLFGGLIAGLLGVSPGGILVPVLAIGLGLEQHRAQAVSLAAQLLPTSLPGVLHYHR